MFCVSRGRRETQNIRGSRPDPFAQQLSVFSPVSPSSPKRRCPSESLSPSTDPDRFARSIVLCRGDSPGLVHSEDCELCELCSPVGTWTDPVAWLIGGARVDQYASRAFLLGVLE